MNATTHPETVDLILDFARGGPAQQLVDVDALDSKVHNIFAASSIVMGLTGFTVGRDFDGSGTVTTLLIGAAGAYLACVVATIWALFPRTFKGPTYSVELWRDYRDLPPEQLKPLLAESLTQVFEHNAKQMAPKLTASNFAIVACALEVLAVAAMFIVARIA